MTGPHCPTSQDWTLVHVFLMIRWELWILKRKTTEVKYRFQHSIPGTHSMNRTYNADVTIILKICFTNTPFIYFRLHSYLYTTFTDTTYTGTAWMVYSYMITPSPDYTRFCQLNFTQELNHLIFLIVLLFFTELPLNCIFLSGSLVPQNKSRHKNVT